MTNTPSQPTESDIRRWTGEASFERGQRYFEHGHILNPRRLGDTRLYREQAERLIAARNRGSYATAAAYLVRVRDLYHRLGEPDTWQQLIAELRERHRRLRALKEELHNAGL